VTPDGLLALTNTTDQAKAHAFHPVPLHLRLPSSESAATTARSFSTRHASSSPSCPPTTS
jgi:hypothetical protein